MAVPQRLSFLGIPLPPFSQLLLFLSRRSIQAAKAVLLLFLVWELTFRGSRWLVAERAAFRRVWKLPMSGKATAVYMYFHWWRSWWRAFVRVVRGQRTSPKWSFLLEVAMEFLTVPNYRYIIDQQYGGSMRRFARELAVPIAAEGMAVLDSRVTIITQFLFRDVRIQKHPEGIQNVSRPLTWVDFPGEEDGGEEEVGLLYFLHGGGYVACDGGSHIEYVTRILWTFQQRHKVEDLAIFGCAGRKYAGNNIFSRNPQRTGKRESLQILDCVYHVCSEPRRVDHTPSAVSAAASSTIGARPSTPFPLHSKTP